MGIVVNHSITHANYEAKLYPKDLYAFLTYEQRNSTYAILALKFVFLFLSIPSFYVTFFRKILLLLYYSTILCGEP